MRTDDRPEIPSPSGENDSVQPGNSAKLGIQEAITVSLADIKNISVSSLINR